MKLKNSNCDDTQKLKLLWNSKTQIVMKLENSNCDKTQTQIVMNPNNSKCDEIQKLKLWQNSNCDKFQIVTKLKLYKNSNCDKTWKLKNSNCEEKNQKLKFWQNSKTWIVTKLESWQISSYEEKLILKGSFSKNILTPWQPMRCSLGSVLQFSRCILFLFEMFCESA